MAMAQQQPLVARPGQQAGAVQARPGAGPAAAPEPPPGGQVPPPSGEPASEVEQVQRSGIMAAAADAMYGEQGLDSTLALLESGGDIIENAARGTAMLMHSIASSLRAQGKEISDDALLDAGEEVLARMLGLAVDAGIAQIGDPQQMQAAVEQGGQMALEIYQSMSEQPAQAPPGQPPPGQAPPGAGAPPPRGAANGPA